MATAPLLPGLVEDRVRHQGALKPDTWTSLQMRKRHVPRATQLRHAYELTPYLAGEDGPAGLDFLAEWYFQVRAQGEHASTWGQLGLSPTHFTLTFAQVPLLVIHNDATPWKQARGLMMVLWRDDEIADLRTRLHFWVHPAYRSLQLSVPLGQVLLRYLFDDLRFKLVEGRTPTVDRPALSYIKRLGFQPVATLPYGEWAWSADGQKTLTPVVQSMLTVEQWERTQYRLE